MSSAAGRIAVVSVAAGVLVAAILIPFTGLVGVATRDAAQTFNDLNVQALGHVPTRSEILDSEGHLIAFYYPGGIYRIPVGYDQISPVMRNAIVAIEDSRFYLHGAMDPRGTVRAFVNDVKNEPVQGGSTLAQQYVKNALILTSRSKSAQQAAAADTPERKIRELRIAADVEQEMTKPQLLAAYLNVAYFENNAYGVQVAAERYFKTSAKDLTLAQSALLAGMVENPAADDPFSHPRHAKQRRNTVLERMAQLGYVTKAAAAKAAAKGLGLHPSTIPLQTGCYAHSARHAAYFCDYVLAVLRRDAAYKKTYRDLNSSGGLKIYTTLNVHDETAAQNAVSFVVPDHSSTYNPNHNADAEVLIQPRTGRVRAIAVDRHYGTAAGDNNIDYAVDTKYDGGAGVQTGLLVEAVHPDYRPQGGRPVRLRRAHGVARLHQWLQQLQGAGCGRVLGAQRRGRGQGHLQPVHRDDPVDQRVLRDAGAEGRPVQHRQDGGQHGRAPGRRRLPAQGGRQERPRRLPVPGRRPPVVHPGRGQRLADEHGRRLRHRRGARHLLQAGRHRADHGAGRQGPARGVRELPPGVLRGRRRRRHAHPGGRHRLGHGGRPGDRPPGSGQDRDRGRRRPTPRSAATPRTWRATCRSSTR